MGAALDLTGKVFGRLTVIRRAAHRGKNRSRHWRCLCECKNVKVIRGSHLTGGQVQSCGCLRWESIAERLPSMTANASVINTIHGYSPKKRGTPTYHSWENMIQRCTNPSNTNYPRYGAKGVTPCNRWLNSFADFLADVGERPPGTTLGRFMDIGNYEPGNCRWMTRAEQSAERRKKNEFLRGRAA